jgi:hypothetical protein
MVEASRTHDIIDTLLKEKLGTQLDLLERENEQQLKELEAITALKVSLDDIGRVLEDKLKKLELFNQGASGGVAEDGSKLKPARPSTAAVGGSKPLPGKKLTQPSKDDSHKETPSKLTKNPHTQSEAKFVVPSKKGGEKKEDNKQKDLTPATEKKEDNHATGKKDDHHAPGKKEEKKPKDTGKTVGGSTDTGKKVPVGPKKPIEKKEGEDLAASAVLERPTTSIGEKKKPPKDMTKSVVVEKTAEKKKEDADKKKEEKEKKEKEDKEKKEKKEKDDKEKKEKKEAAAAEKKEAAEKAKTNKTVVSLICFKII